MSGDLNTPAPHEDESLRRQLVDGYGTPPPDGEFVESLGKKLEQEFQGERAPEVRASDSTPRMLMIVLAGLAACFVVVVMSFGAGVWLIARGFHEQAEPDRTVPAENPGQVEPAREPAQEPERFERIQKPARQDNPTARPAGDVGPQNVAENDPQTPPHPPGPDATMPPSHPAADAPRSIPVASGPSSGGRPEPKAEPAVPYVPDEIFRYGWQPGKTYAYGYQLEAQAPADVRVYGTLAYTASLPTRMTAPQRRVQQVSGSSFVVSREGHLLTCAHVVKGATRIAATFAGRDIDVQVLDVDLQNDLALLKVADVAPEPLSLGDSDAVELAQDVRVVGYPLTDVLGSSVKITRGTVAGIVDRDDERLIQIDAAINAGNSGGPLLNDRGEVIGVASAKLSGEEISNVGFAVPIVEAQSLLQKHGVTAASSTTTDRLEGPDLVRRVAPSVLLLKVTIGPGGYGIEKQVELGYSATMVTKDSSPDRSRAGISRPGIPRPGRMQPPFGPGIGGPPRFQVSSPESERGQVLVDVAGEIYNEATELNLPFLMGPVAHLAIEPLSGPGEKHWYRKRTISILHTKKEEGVSSPFPGSPFMGPPSFRHPYHPFGRQPREPREKVVRVTTAMERYDYAFETPTTDTLSIKKTYKLESLDEDLSVTASGVVVFDRAEAVPDSSTMEGTFSTVIDGQSVRVSFKFSYKRGTRAEKPNSSTQTPATIAANPPSKEKLPLTPAQLEKTLTDIRSSKRGEVLRALAQLAAAKPTIRRVDVARALEQKLSDSDTFVRQSSLKALRVWGSERNQATFIAALQDSWFSVRNEAIDALADMPSQASATAIVQAYKPNRIQAKAALIKMGPTAEVAVQKLLQHEDWPIQMDACDILGKIGTRHSIPVLHQTVARTKMLVQSRAKAAIQEIQKR